MKPVLKFITAVLNIIFSCFKLLPVKNKITFISRQSDSKSEDMIMLEDALRDRLPDIILLSYVEADVSYSHISGCHT